MESSKEVFAEGICFKKILLIFIFGSLFGCVMEVGLHFLKYNNLVSRQALIYGPFNPVYGFGAAIITLCLGKQTKPLLIFIWGALLGGAVEYSCSFIQEHVFGTISWNYSNHFLNFNGRTSLFYMLCWGMITLVYIKFFYPFLSRHIEKIPIKIGKILTVFLTILIILDAAISITACYRMKERINDEKANNKIEVFLDKHYPNERLKKIYPNAKKIK